MQNGPFLLGSLEKNMMQLVKSVCVCVCVCVCVHAHTHMCLWARIRVYDTEGESKRKRFHCFPKFLIDYLTWHVGSGNLGN